MAEEDEEGEIELIEPTVSKTKSVALPFASALGGVQKTPAEEEKSQVYQKRHKLFTELK